MSTAAMFDSISRKWPADAKVILAYVDNPLDPGNHQAAVATGAIVVPVSIFGAPGVRVYDCEPGALWPPTKCAQVLGGEVRAGRRPTAYASLSNISGIQAQVWGLGVSPSQIDWFQAHFDNVNVLPPGYVAKQFASNSEFDTSIVSQAWLDQVATEPQPPFSAPLIPDPTKGMLQMLLVRNPGAPITLDNGAELAQGTICACDAAGAVNLGIDWPSVQAAYPDEPVIESATLLARFAKISLH